jgi:ribonuclease III
VADLAALQERLGYRFRDEHLIRLALTHPSVAHEQNNPLPHNQRLEFLGDAVLGAILSRELFKKFPDADEGLLTKSRAKLVNRTTLAAHGRAMDLGAHLRLSKGEENSGGRERDSSLTDAFEAILGAMFLDGGFDAVCEFVLREFSSDLEPANGNGDIGNPKGELQELLQARSPNAPQYQTISAEGPDHAPEFECAVLHDGVELARGRGKSKRTAEANAALEALKILTKQSAS